MIGEPITPADLAFISDRNRVAYAAWLLADAQHVPAGTTMKRFVAALDTLALPWRPREMTLYTEGIVAEIEGREVLIEYAAIGWKPERRLHLVGVDLYHIDGVFTPGREHHLFWQEHWGQERFVQTTWVWRLDAFKGSAIVDVANRAWARAHLSQHVAFAADDIIVPALQPLHPAVAEALYELANFPALDNDLYSALLTEAEVAEWEDRGRADFRRLLANRIKEYLAHEYYAQNISFTVDVDARTWTDEQTGRIVTEGDIEDAVLVNLDAVYGNIQQHVGSVWDEDSGFVFRGLMKTLDEQLRKDDLTIAPILLSLGLPVRTGDQVVACAFCGLLLHQSTDYLAWLDDSDDPLCPSRVGTFDPRHDPQL